MALFAFLAVWLITYSLIYAGKPIVNLVQNWPLLFSVFLPNVAVGLFIPSFGEEPGWRGFALPRLQVQYGPLTATLVLGALHGLWHLPAFFTPMLLGPFSFGSFVPFVLTAIAGTFIYTWVFNNTRGSVLIAVLMHAASNAATNLMTAIVPSEGGLPAWLDASWLNVIAFGLAAVLLLAFTGRRLSFRPGMQHDISE